MRLGVVALCCVSSFLLPVEGGEGFFCHIFPWFCEDTCTAPNANPTDSTDSKFSIDFAFQDVPETEQAKFIDAANRWRQVIIGDLSDTTTFFGVSECGKWPSTIDDLHICAAYKPIDGKFKVLGYAGPIGIRLLGSDKHLPIAGYMVFDVDDVDIAAFKSVILHEMGHILGIGTVMRLKGLSGSFGDCEFSAFTKTANEWRCLTGCTNSVPLQPGRCGHWDEECLVSELMTPNLGPVKQNLVPLSRITVASLEDMGYKVNYDGADAFSVTDVNPSCLCSSNRRLGETSSTRQFLLSQAQVEAAEYAMDFGRERLRENQQSASKFDGNGSVRYVGGEWMSVFYHDPDTGGVAYRIVTTDDLED